MKKIFIFIAASLVFLSLRAQITQSESDSIVLERMSQETRQNTIHAKENVQTNYSITTSQGEELELDYPCWIYYINYLEEVNNTGHYLVVKESNGNLLEVKTKNNVEPSDLTQWRIIPEEPLDSLVLIAQGVLYGNGQEGITKGNRVITTETAWENLKTAMNTINNVTDNFTETNIDFSKYQIIAVFDEIKPNGGWTIEITDIMKYADSIVITYTNLGIGEPIFIEKAQPYYVVKIPLSDKLIVFHDETVPTNYPIEIPFTEYSLDSTFCQWTNVASDTVIIISSNEELENYVTCTSGSYPAIDFSKYQIIAVFDKIRPNSNWTVDITDIKGYADSIVISYTNLGIGEPIFVAETQPYYVVKIPLLNKEIVFHDETILTSPIPIPFTEYSLDSVSCQWTNVASDTIIIINNNNELENYITCKTGSYPTIDFNQYTLLLLHGNINYYIFSTAADSLMYFLPNEYLLVIEMSLDDTAVIPQEWYIAIIVPKLATATMVLLDINYQNGNGVVPSKNCFSGYVVPFLNGIGYLFVDSIPSYIQYQQNIMYIVYYKEQNSATFVASNMPYYVTYIDDIGKTKTELIYTGFLGNICNFPDYAKKWIIPSNGKQIYYEGEFYEGVYFPYVPRPGHGNLTLTILK